MHNFKLTCRIKRMKKTQKEIAEAVGISEQKMSNIVNGYCRTVAPDVQEAIAGFLDTTKEKLF